MWKSVQIAGCVALLCLLAAAPARTAAGFKRIAVLPFENTTKEKALDWVGGGIAESLTTDLAKFQDFTVVERGRLNDALKEIKLGQSAAVDSATAQRTGRILGADSIIVGSFQRVGDEVRINARIIDVETASVKVTTRVDGAFKVLLTLQSEVAAKLIEEMKGTLGSADRKRLETAPARSLEAVQALSDGAYFLRSDLITDAITEFDQAIALDPSFTEAHYYRGVALARLKRFDEAVTALKRTLPRTVADQPVKWTWAPPVDAQSVRRGLFLGLDKSAVPLSGVISAEDGLRARKRTIYTERVGARTILHFIDLATRTSSRVEIPDDGIPIGTGMVWASDRVTVVPVTTPALSQSGSIGLYGVGSAGVLWHATLTGEPGRPPEHDLWGSTLFEFYAGGPRVAAFEAETHKLKWERTGLLSDSSNFKVVGDVALLTSRSDRQVHAMRMSDGTDLWTIPYSGSSNHQLVNDRVLVVFEPDRRMLTVDLKTGRVLIDLAVPPLAISAGPAAVNVPSVIKDNRLYFVSAANELHAIDLAPTAGARALWKTPLPARVTNLQVSGDLVYGGAQTGELVIVDSTNGALRAARRIVERPLSIVHASDEVVLGNTPGTLFAFEPRTGSTVWQRVNFMPIPAYFKGVIFAQPAATQVVMLDAQTGNPAWQAAGSPIAAWAAESSVFVLDSSSVREYVLDRAAAQGVTSKEAMTELASVLLAKGDVDEAARFADRVANESDPDYPPLRLVQARIAQARGNAVAARRELAVYTDLVGRQSKAATDVIAGFKASDGLLWLTELGGAPSFTGQFGGTRVFAGVGPQVVALDAATGRNLWRQNVERLLGPPRYDPDTQRLFYAHGLNADQTAFRLSMVNADGTGRRDVLARSLPGDIAAVNLTVARGRLFVRLGSVNRQAGGLSVRLIAIAQEDGKVLWETPLEYTQAQLAQVRGGQGMFFPRGDHLVYSYAFDVRVVAAATGEVVNEHREVSIPCPKGVGVDPPDVPLASTTYVVGTNELVIRTPLTGGPGQRVRIPAQDPAFSACSGRMRGTTIVERDGTSFFGFDVTPGVEDAKRLKWRLSPPAGQAFTQALMTESSLLVTQAAAGASSRADVTILQVNAETGRIEREIQPLWSPAAATLVDGRLIVTTVDGLVYAMDLK